MILSVRELIENWPSPSTTNFGRDIGITVEHASGFRQRNSIPVAYWPAIVAAAAARGIDGITNDLLVAIHTASSDGASV